MLDSDTQNTDSTNFILDMKTFNYPKKHGTNEICTPWNWLRLKISL